MLQIIKKRFIVLSMLVLICIMLAIISGVTIISLRSISTDSDMYLQWMASIENIHSDEQGFIEKDEMYIDETTQPPYYFAVTYDISDHSIDNIKSFDNSFNYNEHQIALDFFDKALKSNNTSGYVHRYRYFISMDETVIKISFLDVDYRLDQLEHTLLFTSAISTIFVIAAYFVFNAITTPIIHKLSKEFEHQTHRITNAGHLIKTPLTIIRANADVLKIDYGNNESIDEIKLQTDRLTSFVNDIITMSQMDERLMTNKESSNLSNIIEETVHGFNTLFIKKNLTIDSNIQPFLFCNGNEKSLRQLISTLFENALKYSPEGGKIIIDFKNHKNMSVLKIINNTENPIQRDILPNLFERYYRYDSSRVPHNDSFGIGLSIAKTITLANNGRIEAAALDDYTFQICVEFPS